MSKCKLAVVVPCYNEEETLPSSINKLCTQLNKLIDEAIISNESFIYFVNDGSIDKTWQIIESTNSQNPSQIKGLCFTRNFGNQQAIIAGLEAVNKIGVDAAITIDADLQQDETKMKEFIQKFQEGADIVGGVRNDRKADNFIKKTTSTMFYKFMNMLGIKIQPNHSEYRLVSKKTLNVLSGYQETNLFLRGLFYELGLRTEYVYFDVKKREYGQTKFSFVDLMRLAARAITSFSSRPLRFVFFTGIVIAFISFIFGLYSVYALYHNHTSIHMSMYSIEPFEIFETFLAGVQILCIGVIGEYIGQILQEVKARPRYIKDKELK